MLDTPQVSYIKGVPVRNDFLYPVRGGHVRVEVVIDKTTGFAYTLKNGNVFPVAQEAAAAAVAAHVLQADPHTQYTLADGSRPFTGTVGGIDPVAGPDLVTLDYLNAAIAVVTYTPSTLTVATGTLDSGNVASLQTLDDGNQIAVSEHASTPGFDIIGDFTGITELPQRAQIHVRYDGSAGHTVKLQIFNYTGAVWVDLTQIVQTGDLVWLEVALAAPADYVNGSGQARLRINHTSAGNNAHNIFVEYMALVKMGFGATTDHGALVGLLDLDHPQYEQVSKKDAASGYAGLDAVSRTTKGVDTTDDLIVDLATKGLVLKDTAGTPHFWRLSVSVLGVITTTDLGTAKP